MALLEFNNIKKSFAKKEVLRGVSFSVEKGEIFGVIGVSGGGKSTLFNILMGLVREDSGYILFDGKKIGGGLGDLAKKAGFATQSNMILDELTIKENAFYFGSLYGVKRKVIKETLEKLLKLVSLKGFENTLVRNLSGGMTKRANLLIALIHDPELLILDEPTVGLDSLLRDSLWEYIRNINEAGKTVIVASHLIDEIQKNCSRVAILKGGKIYSVGTLKEYFEHYGSKKSLHDIFREVMKNENS